MKKALLSLLVALPLCQASAQYKLQHAPVETPPRMETRHIRSVADVQLNDGTANKTNAAAPRWYNHWDALASFNSLNRNDTALATALLMWQDSTVNYGGTSSGFGIQWLSAAEFFAPNTTLYNSNNLTNRGKMAITTQAYNLDSVMIRGFYERPFNTYSDSLILTFVPEATTGKFTYLSFGGNTLANHGTDSAAAILWAKSAYLLPAKMPNGIHQVSYNYTGNTLGSAVRVAVGLDQARFIDSLSDGSQMIKAAVNIPVPANGKVSMSVSFKSGAPYTAGSPYTNYNRFFLMSHETIQDDFVQYPTTDQNMSYLLSKDSTNKSVSATLGYFIPTIAFNGTGTSNFNGEVHDISWKISCATCPKVSVNDVLSNVNIGAVYPNPANNTITVPFSVTANANVNVSVSNLLGQVLMTQSFNNVAAGQSKKAVFNTSELANGVYIYTVESEGSRVANRVTVAH